jgi:hypothetical protein
MGWFRSKSPRTKAILIQLAIAVGLVVYFKIALPRIEKARATEAAERREKAIRGFYQSVVIDEPGSPDEPAAKSDPPAARRRLKITPAVGDVEQTLGLPDARMTDFRGGQHLTWTGTAHKLEASFNKGSLYAITWTDLGSGHGETVQEWSAQYRKF